MARRRRAERIEPEPSTEPSDLDIRDRFARGCWECSSPLPRRSVHPSNVCDPCHPKENK